MLQFIVLGLVPGTHLQITYLGMLIFVNVVVLLLSALIIYEIMWIKPQWQSHRQNVSGTKNTKNKNANQKSTKSTKRR